MATTVTVKGNLNPFINDYQEALISGQMLSDVINTYTAEIAKRKDVRHELIKRLVKYSVVYVNGVKIDAERWDSFVVYNDDEIICQSYPLGGGGGGGSKRNVLTAVVAISAIIVSSVTAGAAPAVLGAAGAGLLGGLAGAAVSIAGMLAINALAPIKSAGIDSDPQTTSYSIQSYQNQYKPFSAVPVLLGRMRIAPLFAAQPYSENTTIYDGGIIRESKQRVNMLFVWGYAAGGTPEDLKIGDTLLSSYNNSYVKQTTSVYQPGAGYRGNYYKGSVTETPVNVQLDNVNVPVIAATKGEADSVGIDIAFPGGLYRVDSGGKRKSLTVYFEIMYRRVGSAVWQSAVNNVLFPQQNIRTKPFSTAIVYIDGVSREIVVANSYENTLTAGDIKLYRIIIQIFGIKIDDLRTQEMKNNGYFVLSPTSSNDEWTLSSGRITFPTISITSASASSLIITHNIPLELGEYEVSVRRVTPSAGGVEYTDTAIFYLLRTKRNAEPIKFPYTLLITEMSIEANAQLSGTVDNFTGVLQSYIPDWDESRGEWTDNYTSNPASLIRYVLTGAPNQRRVDISRINNDSFVEFWRHCNANDLEYNRYIDTHIDIENNLLPEIAAAGRGFVVIENGRYSIAIDKAKDTYVQHFTPANSWGFSSERRFLELPHAFRISFINQLNSYQADERIVYDDGFNEGNAYIYETIQLSGVTHPDQIYKMGREYIKAARLRPETHTLTVDMEYLVAGRRDLVKVSHDVLMIGFAYGRIKNVRLEAGVVTGVTLENTAVMNEGVLYGLAVRNSETLSMIEIKVDTNPGEHYSLVFSAPVPPDTVKQGDLYAFGEYERTTEDYIISKIEPQEGLNAKITLISYSPEIYQKASDPIPPFTSNVGLESAPQYSRPAPPTNINIKETLELRGNEAVSVAYVNWLPPVASPVLIDGYEIAYRQVDESWLFAEITADRNFEFIGLIPGYYDFRIRSISKYGIPSEWETLSDYFIYSDTAPPPDVEGLTTYYTDNRLQLIWDDVNDIRPIKYEVRLGESWNNSIIISMQAEKIYPLSQDGKYHIKAVAKSGIYSINPASINITGASGWEENIVARYEDAPTWFGDKTGFVIDELDGTMNLQGDFNHGEYYSEHELLLASATEVQINLHCVAKAYSSDDDMYALEDIYSVLDIYSTTAGLYDIQLQIQIMDNNDVWGEWQEYHPGSYIGKSFRFRLLADIENTGIILKISSFAYSIDVPDRVIAKHNQLIPAEGYTWQFVPPFNNNLAVSPPVVIGVLVFEAGQINNKQLYIDPDVNNNRAFIYVLDDVGNPTTGHANLYAQGY